MSVRPFKFLDSYTRQDADIFFGRDKEIEELHTKIFQSKLLLVYGVSGSGKSSLVNCGLGSRFQPTDWLPINVRRKQNMVQDMTQAVAAACVTPLTGKPGLIKALRSVYLDHFMPVYLILDQLEELFIFGDEEEQTAFITAIAKVLAASEELNVKIVLVIREEYLARLTAFEETVPELFENRARLERMTWRNATLAIEGPCARAGIELEEGFSEKLLANIAAGRKDVELTFLQVYLDRVYDRMEQAGGQRFTLDLLERIGAVSDVLGQFLDEQIATFSDPEQAMTVLKAFVSTHGTKKLITTEEAVAFTQEIGKAQTSDAVNSVIRRAVDLRLLKDQDDQGRYELRHDSLAATIYAKISLFEKELIEIKQFVEQAHGSFLKRRTLLRPEDLKYIAPYEDRLFLSKEQRAFIAQSKKEATRKYRRRLVLGISITSVVLVVLTVLTIRAQQARTAALEQKSIAEKESLRAGDAERSALRAKEDSDRQRAAADSLRDRAIENARELEKAIAEKDEARIQSLQNERKAIESSAAEAEQRRLAELKSHQLEEESKRTTTALEKEKLANDEKERVNRLHSASTIAQNSMTVSDPALRGLMAVQALRFMEENKGNTHSQEVITALYGALHALELKDAWKVGGLAGETRVMVPDQRPSQLLVMGNKGILQHVDMDARYKTVVRDLSDKLLPGDRAFLSSSHQQMLFAHGDGSLEVWSVASGTRIARGDRGTSAQEIGAFSSFGDNGPFVTGERVKGHVVLWSLQGSSLKELRSFDADAGVRAFEPLPGRNEIACITGSAAITIIAADGTTRRIALPSHGTVTKAAIDPVGHVLVVGTSDGSIAIVDPVANKATLYVTGTGRACDAIAVSGDGRWIAAVNSAGELSLYDRSKKLDDVNLRPSDGSPAALSFGDNDALYLGYDDGKVIRLLFTASAMSDRICKLCTAQGRKWTAGEWEQYIDVGTLRNTCGGN